MLLVVDVGNTNITFGIYREKELLTTFRIMSKTPRTSDEFGIIITEIIVANKIKPEEITGSIIGSVVPNVMHSLMGGIRRYLKTEPLIL